MNEKPVKPVKKKDVKQKKSAGERTSKALAVICIIVAIVLVCVTAFAFISSKGNKEPDSGEVAPEIITTTSATTTTAATTTTLPEGITIKGDVYAVSEADILAEPYDTAQVLGKLYKADSIAFVSVDENGWCTVVYQGKVCYVHRNYLSTKKPEEVATAETTTKAPATEKKVVNLKQKQWSLVIVDKNNVLPENFVPQLEYVAGSEQAMDSRVALYYNAMYKAAYDDGIILTPYSGYRSYTTQQENYDALVQDYLYSGYSQQEAEEKAATEILPAGSSEHNLGFAMDIGSADASFKDTDAYKWLCENAYLYGFIERYPEGKQNVTGVMHEPWHWRYVGPIHAERMKDDGFKTLEEYDANRGEDY